MRKPLLLLSLLAFATALLAFRILHQAAPPATAIPQKRAQLKILRCSPDWSYIVDADIPPMPGAGTYAWKISTRSDSAQYYFNQGINMYYSFHIIEAMASFKKASRFDPDCAMLWWAQALAYGPNINDYGYAASPAALEAIQKAKALSDNCSAAEKGLIAAQAIRYTADSADTNRKQLNEQYTRSMKALHEQFPTHSNIATLYADAMMLEHPWELWNTDGTPKPWTPRIRSVLEQILKQDPANPGANHYYIHVMEPSPYAALALPAADRLGKLTPGLSHTVHMPSHIYLRTGQFGKGVSVNEKAVASYEASIPQFAPVTGADFLYLIHNLHMQTNNALLEGRNAYAVKTAAALKASIPDAYLSLGGAMGNLLQYVHRTSILVDIRFGNWESLLNSPEPDAAQTYARILWHFGRGMAQVHKKQLHEAKESLSQIGELAKDSVLQIPFTPFSPAADGVTIAASLLEGTIAQEENNLTAAIAAYRKAVATEAAMVYNEPRDWLLNPRHYLADALLQAGQADEAIAVLKADLSVNNENGWALWGMSRAYALKKQTAAAAAWKARYSKAFRNSDTPLYGTVIH